MQCVSLLNRITPFFNTHCVVIHKRSGPICEKKISVVIEAAHAQHPQLHHHQHFVHAKQILVLQACDNSMELRPDYMGDSGRSSTFGCLITSKIATEECARPLSWIKRTLSVPRTVKPYCANILL
jgi:hypothetical protein